MKDSNQELLAFLNDQLHWYKNQDQLYSKIEHKLYELKLIAEYREAEIIPDEELTFLMVRVDQLKNEIEWIVSQLGDETIH